MRTVKETRRKDGSYIRFDENAVVIINDSGRAAGDAHLRPGRARAAREEVHEDRLAGAGGLCNMRMLKYTQDRSRRGTSGQKRHAQNAERVKLHVTKGDTVRVMRGDDKGKEGKVIRVFPKTGRVIGRGHQHREEASQGAHAPRSRAASSRCRRRSTRRT